MLDIQKYKAINQGLKVKIKHEVKDKIKPSLSTTINCIDSTLGINSGVNNIDAMAINSGQVKIGNNHCRSKEYYYYNRKQLRSCHDSGCGSQCKQRH